MSSQTSSIYADLKKYAGPIKAIKISSDPEPNPPVLENTNNTNEPTPAAKKRSGLKSQRVSTATDDTIKITTKVTNTSVKQALIPPTPEMTIETIAAMIKLPLTPLCDQNGFVHDTVTIAAKCPRGHLHKYFVKDITADNGISKCITCSSGTKFMVTVRETAETTIGLPFILTEKRLDSESNSVEYANPVLKIVINCSRIAGKDSITTVEGQTLLKIHPTTSLKKIKEALFLLVDQPTLSDEQRTRIQALKPLTKTPAEAKKKKIFPKDPLPFTPELASLNTAGADNPMLAQMQLNIVTSDVQNLYLENC